MGIAVEHAVGKPSLAQVLPHILCWIQLRGPGRQVEQGQIGWQLKLVGRVPSCSVKQDKGVRAVPRAGRSRRDGPAWQPYRQTA